MNWVVENIELFLPRYLSDTTKNVLIDSLRQFPDNIDQRFYLNHTPDPDSILQGDGIGELTVVHLESQRFYSAPCVVVSNSCDISPENQRHTPLNFCYAPVFRLSKYHECLVTECGEEKAHRVLTSIRRQYVTPYFYLPACSGLSYEGIVFLDQITNCPNSPQFSEELRGKRLFTLSQYGFYLFLFKLSIHFTRMGEGLDRDAGVAAT